MKKLLGFMNLAALFAAVTFVSSCQKEDFQDTPQDAVEDDGTRAAFKGGTDGKSANNIAWEDGDKVKVIEFHKEGSKYIIQDRIVLMSKTDHPGAISNPTPKQYYKAFDFNKCDKLNDLGKKFLYQAFYPAGQVQFSSNMFLYTLPSDQTPCANGSIDPKADLIVSEKSYAKYQRGVKDKPTIGLNPFHRISSIGRISLKDTERLFKRVTITSDKPLAGSYKFKIWKNTDISTNNGLELESSSNMIVLNSGKIMANNLNNYAVCFSCLADEKTKHNLTITVTTVDDQVFTRTYNGIVFSPNTVTDIPFEIVTKTMMTYNVYGFDMYKNKETSAYIQGSSNNIYKDIANVIEASKASIVGLNEVFNGNTHGNQPELLRKELVTAWDGKKDNSHRWAFSKALTRNNESYGNAIVYRNGRDGGEGGFTLSTKYKCYRPLTDNNGTKQTNAKGEIIYFSKAEEVRSVSYAVFSDCVFASVHLGLSSAGRSDQVKTLTEEIDKLFSNEDKPVFLCGDFNADYNSITNTYFTKESGYVKDTQESIVKLMSADTWTRLTESEVSSHPSTNNRLDHFFVYNKGKWSGNVVVTSELVPDQFINGNLVENPTQLGSKKATSLRRLSDHLPVIITVKWVK